MSSQELVISTAVRAAKDAVPEIAMEMATIDIELTPGQEANMKTIEVPDDFPVAEVVALAEKHGCDCKRVNYHTMRLVRREQKTAQVCRFRRARTGDDNQPPPIDAMKNPGLI